MPNIDQRKRRFSIEIKAISADGSFEGLLAVYNNVDLGKDLIEAGAFTKTIQEHGSEVPLLWQHDTEEPIGKLTLIDGPDALRVNGQLLMDLPMAQKAYLLLKAGIIKGLSIGYDTIKEAVEGKVRRLKELRLWEGSIVTFPMNEAAMVTAIKAMKENKEDFDTELAEVQLQDAGYQMMCALHTALCSLVWTTGMSSADKVTAAEITLQQFTVAYLSYLPLYLAYLTEEYGDMETMKRDGIALKAKRSILHLKEGRKLSTATVKSLKEAHAHVKSLDDILSALFADPADDDTNDDESVDDTADAKAVVIIPEPVDHSAVTKLLDAMKRIIPPSE